MLELTPFFPETWKGESEPLLDPGGVVNSHSMILSVYDGSKTGYGSCGADRVSRVTTKLCGMQRVLREIKLANSGFSTRSPNYCRTSKRIINVGHTL